MFICAIIKIINSYLDPMCRNRRPWYVNKCRCIRTYTFSNRAAPSNVSSSGTLRVSISIITLVCIPFTCDLFEKKILHFAAFSLFTFSPSKYFMEQMFIAVKTQRYIVPAHTIEPLRTTILLVKFYKVRVIFLTANDFSVA